MQITQACLMIFISYLFGSLSSAIITCKLIGLPNPRTTGSNNPGATNVLRIGGKKAAAITLFGDVLKGFIPVYISILLAFPPSIVSLVAIAAFMGHLFPLFFAFQGGKGVATLLGCLFALSWPTACYWIGVWLIVAFISRYSSLAAIIASLFLPLTIWQVSHDISYVYATAFMSVMLILRHRENIKKLLAGKETKIGQKKLALAPQATIVDKPRR